jgi:hypothetical protein
VEEGDDDNKDDKDNDKDDNDDVNKERGNCIYGVLNDQI